MKYKYYLLACLLITSLIPTVSFALSQEITMDEETYEYFSQGGEDESLVEENLIDPLHEDHLYGMWKTACLNKKNKSEKFLKAFFINENKQHLFTYIGYIYKDKKCLEKDLEIQSSGFYTLKNNKRNTAEVHNKNAFITIKTSNQAILDKLKKRCPEKDFKLNTLTKIFSEDKVNCKKDDLLNPTEIDYIHLTDKGHLLTYISKTSKGITLTKILTPKEKPTDKKTAKKNKTNNLESQQKEHTEDNEH